MRKKETIDAIINTRSGWLSSGMERKWNRDESIYTGNQNSRWEMCLIVGLHSHRNLTVGSLSSRWKPFLTIGWYRGSLRPLDGRDIGTWEEGANVSFVGNKTCGVGNRGKPVHVSVHMPNCPSIILIFGRIGL